MVRIALLLVLAAFASDVKGFRGLRPVNEGEQIHHHTSSNHSGTHLLEHHNPDTPPSPGPLDDVLEEYHLNSDEEEREMLTEKLYGRIQKDFEPWADGITLDMVERLYCTDYARSFRFQVVNGEPYIVGEIPGFLEFNRMTKLLLLEVISMYAIPDVDVVITTADECPYPAPFNGDLKVCDRMSPLLSFDRGRDQNKTCIPIPDHTFGPGGWPLAKIPGWKDAKLIFQLNEAEMVTWEDRNPRLFFRGAPTGSRQEIMNDPILAGDDRFDARLTGWTGETRDEDYISLPAHCNYKYLMHMPGNGYSARLKYLLMCGSPVIFPYGGLEEFWYHLLENDKNIKLLEWNKGRGEQMGRRIADAFTELTDDTEKAKEMAKNAQNMIHAVLTPDVGPRYLAKVLIEYAKLQKFVPTVHKDATPLRMSAMGPDAHYDVYSRTCNYCKDPNHGEQAS